MPQPWTDAVFGASQDSWPAPVRSVTNLVVSHGRAWKSWRVVVLKIEQALAEGAGRVRPQVGVLFGKLNDKLVDMPVYLPITAIDKTSWPRLSRDTKDRRFEMRPHNPALVIQPRSMP